MSYTVQVEEYHPSQVPGLFNLFRGYFAEGDRLLSADYLEWLYGGNPFGRGRMVSVSQNGTWVAFVALIPIAFERAGASVPAYYAVNALVDPQHQGHHLFARMIAAAREHIAGEGCVLVGHPNAQAMKTWNRAAVHFQEVLRPTLALPWARHRGWTARSAYAGSDLQGLDDVFKAQAGARDHWKVSVSSAYLQWRYFNQPNNRYKVQILEMDGHPEGVQIARRMRPGVHLLVDQFIRDEHLPAAASMLPPMTICLVPESGLKDLRSSIIRLPMKKEIPYFFTVSPPVSKREVRHFNLTASDF